jgi:hypothetical protein
LQVIFNKKKEIRTPQRDEKSRKIKSPPRLFFKSVNTTLKTRERHNLVSGNFARPLSLL